MSRIFWDSNLWIYWLEDRGERGAAVRALRQAIWDRQDLLLTSALALAEVLVKPMEKGDQARCELYDRTIRLAATVLGFGPDQAMRYAAIRRDRGIRAPDAIQLACAAGAGTDLFVTNDARLQGKRVEGIQFIVPLERAPL